MFLQKKENKKGLSVVIGYVLLVVISISLALLVYAWMKGFLWKPPKECPEGISLIIDFCRINITSKNLNLGLKNNGLFDIDGFIIRIANESGKIPSKPLLEGSPEEARGEKGDYYVKIEVDGKFENNFSYAEYNNITEIDIIPLKKGMLCNKAKIRQDVDGCVKIS